MSPALDAIILQATAKRRDERFASARQMQSALCAALVRPHGEPTPPANTHLGLAPPRSVLLHTPSAPLVAPDARARAPRAAHVGAHAAAQTTLRIPRAGRVRVRERGLAAAAALAILSAIAWSAPSDAPDTRACTNLSDTPLSDVPQILGSCVRGLTTRLWSPGPSPGPAGQAQAARDQAPRLTDHAPQRVDQAESSPPPATPPVWTGDRFARVAEGVLSRQ